VALVGTEIPTEERQVRLLELLQQQQLMAAAEVEAEAVPRLVLKLAELAARE
jgi:hypothetical protein